jgi:hypothetical protein
MFWTPTATDIVGAGSSGSFFLLLLCTELPVPLFSFASLFLTKMCGIHCWY